MKLNVMFTIAAIVLILFGLLSFFAPPALAGTDPTAAFSAKINGVILLALGVLAWLVRNDGTSKTRDSVVLGYTLLFVLWALVSLYGVTLTDMPSHNISWIPALIQALIAVGFFMAGKASMSASAR
ncbi:MAG: hypothetical protein QY332_16295 [Anaerolineales bacterium]|nr:MAG: hypothetical protein QY332_16295 [Anaerolineales bacterium]